MGSKRRFIHSSGFFSYTKVGVSMRHFSTIGLNNATKSLKVLQHMGKNVQCTLYVHICVYGETMATNMRLLLLILVKNLIFVAIVTPVLPKVYIFSHVL